MIAQAQSAKNTNLCPASFDHNTKWVSDARAAPGRNYLIFANKGVCFSPQLARVVGTPIALDVGGGRKPQRKNGGTENVEDRSKSWSTDIESYIFVCGCDARKRARQIEN
jgi:hypothetical protein